MSVLSEQDIKKELGTGILIYPFKREVSLRSCSLSLTASKYAYSIRQKKLLDIQINSSSQKYIALPPQETILVWTNESVSLDNRFCGSIHSKVALVSQGIGHIGTRVNPNWAGILCIALHNLSNEQICINIAENSEQETADVIAYLRFHKLTSKSSTSSTLDDPGRLDAIPKNRPIPQELNDWINDPGERWRRGNEDALRERLQNSQDYKKIKEDIRKSSFQYWISLTLKKLAAPFIVTLFIVVYLWLEKKQDIGDLILVLIPLMYTVVSEIFKDR